MTAQSNNKIIYKRKEYSIIKFEGKEMIFNPKEYGFEPNCRSTACWDGYLCSFKVEKGNLFLSELIVNDDKEDIKLNDINAEIDESNFIGRLIYTNLNMPLKFSGNLTIANEFIPDYYQHIGLQNDYAFKKVFIFIFIDGILKEIKDLSDDMEIKRKNSKTLKMSEILNGLEL